MACDFDCSQHRGRSTAGWWPDIWSPPCHYCAFDMTVDEWAAMCDCFADIPACLTTFWDPMSEIEGLPTSWDFPAHLQLLDF